MYNNSNSKILHRIHTALKHVTCLQHTVWHRNFLEEERTSKYVILISVLRMVRCVKSMLRSFNPAQWKWGIVSTDHLHASSSNSIRCVLVALATSIIFMRLYYTYMSRNTTNSFTRSEHFSFYLS
jgi:hypothetical protein